MYFFTVSNIYIEFAEKKFIQKFYVTTKALITIKQVELISKKKFTKKTLNKELEILIIYIVALENLLAGI